KAAGGTRAATGFKGADDRDRRRGQREAIETKERTEFITGWRKVTVGALQEMKECGVKELSKNRAREKKGGGERRGGRASRSPGVFNGPDDGDRRRDGDAVAIAGVTHELQRGRRP